MAGSEQRHVFIDESGDPYLDTAKSGVSAFFVLSAVIVEAEKLKEAEKTARDIIRRHFQTGEMKSVAVGGNTNRRIRILNDLSTVPFRHYSQVVDKAEVLTTSGLRYKKSFIKFIHRTVYQRLFQASGSLHVVADEHGTSEFMREFGSYLQRRLPQTLFERSSFRFGDSKDHPLIQFGDMIAGSIARVYSGTDPAETLRPLRSHTILVDEWPPKIPSPATFPEHFPVNDFDLMVRQHAVAQAQIYIDANSDVEDDLLTHARVAAVRYLLYHFRSVDPEEYIPTSAMLGHLRDFGYDMSERMLRSQVIGHLRDSSVFIASSAKGIKIPFSVADLQRFVRQVDERVSPYLGRLHILRRHFLLASQGELEIVDELVYPKLHKYFEQLPG